ncbi:hypothetical protein HD_1097 [[Haemophilus] ducreyi 35000HP]|uniref:Uncharacterized protein n=1 Tax=Haemophilus ducreyi (strain 35000HP / ATCC 700724) TaxID=233412 RepID=Q7VM96_HAEDU|nr:hypothetical protein HD_1097 [[Haemophilus] ducreyi 35000HP]
MEKKDNLLFNFLKLQRLSLHKGAMVNLIVISLIFARTI